MRQLRPFLNEEIINYPLRWKKKQCQVPYPATKSPKTIGKAHAIPDPPSLLNSRTSDAHHYPSRHYRRNQWEINQRYKLSVYLSIHLRKHSCIRSRERSHSTDIYRSFSSIYKLNITTKENAWQRLNVLLSKHLKSLLLQTHLSKRSGNSSQNVLLGMVVLTHWSYQTQPKEGLEHIRLSKLQIIMTEIEAIFKDAPLHLSLPTSTASNPWQSLAYFMVTGWLLHHTH